MVEPIRRVIGPSGMLDGVAGVHGLMPVTRDERPPEREDRERPRKRREPDSDATVKRGEDGRPHVDVRA